MTRLTSRERLDRCYRYQEVDRPGLYLRGARADSPPHPSYKPLRDLAVAKSDLKVSWRYRSPNPAFLIERTVEPVSAEWERCIETLQTPAGLLHGSYLMGLKGQPGMREEHLVKTEEDIEKYLSLPLDEVGGDISSFFDQVAALGDRGIVEVEISPNAAGFVAELLGSEQFALLSVLNRDLIHALLEKRQREILHRLDFLIAQGAGPYFAILGHEYVAPPLHGREDFFAFNVEYDRPIAERIHEAGGLLHVHCHGPLKAVIDGFVDLGADVLHPIEAPPMGDLSAKEAKAALRGRVCIEGNIQIGDMYDQTPENIREQAAALIQDAFGDGKGLILCPTASPFVPEMTPRCLENYAALVDIVTNWSC